MVRPQVTLAECGVEGSKCRRKKRMGFQGTIGAMVKSLTRRRFKFESQRVPCVTLFGLHSRVCFLAVSERGMVLYGSGVQL